MRVCKQIDCENKKKDHCKLETCAWVEERKNDIQDSGERREFPTGAVRDVAEGKGRCDLLPLAQIEEMLDSGMSYGMLAVIDRFIWSGESAYLKEAIDLTIYAFYGDKFMAMLELSKHYEDGAKKYDERNWQIGIPLHCYMDSAIRHYLKLLRGDTDERHDRALLWNLFGAWWTLENKPEMNDLPYREGK